MAVARCSNLRWRPTRWMLLIMALALSTWSSAIADGSLPAPGIPAAPIEVDTSAPNPLVKLPGIEARLLAVVSPLGGVWTLAGKELNAEDLPSSVAPLIEKYVAPAEKPAQTSCRFGVVMEIRRTPGFTEFVSIDVFGGFAGAQARIHGGHARPQDASTDSEGPLVSLLELVLCYESPTGRYDLQTEVHYGPAFDGPLDIATDGSTELHEFMGMPTSSRISGLPDVDPGHEVPEPDRPRVVLMFESAKPLAGYEVQAIRTDGRVVRASDFPERLVPSGSTLTASWAFGSHREVSKASVSKFVLKGYRVQAIRWRNLVLPPNIAPYFRTPLGQSPAGAVPGK